MANRCLPPQSFRRLRLIGRLFQIIRENHHKTLQQASMKTLNQSQKFRLEEIFLVDKRVVHTWKMTKNMLFCWLRLLSKASSRASTASSSFVSRGVSVSTGSSTRFLASVTSFRFRSTSVDTRWMVC